MVQPDRLDGRIISPKFLDAKGDGDFKVVSLFAKRARGAMAGWIVRERVTSMKSLAEFVELGYEFDQTLSSPDEPVFTRRTDA